MEKDCWIKTVSKMNPATIEVFFGIDSDEAKAAATVHPAYKSKWIKRRKGKESVSQVPAPITISPPPLQAGDLEVLQRLFGGSLYLLLYAQYVPRYAPTIKFASYALALRENEVGATHPSLGEILMFLGENYAELGQRAEADAVFKRAVELARGNPDESSKYLGKTFLYYSWLLTDLGRTGEAADTAIKAVDAYRNGPWADEYMLSVARGYYADLLRARGNVREADDIQSMSDGHRSNSLNQHKPRYGTMETTVYYASDGTMYRADSDMEANLLLKRLHFKYSVHVPLRYRWYNGISRDEPPPPEAPHRA